MSKKNEYGNKIYWALFKETFLLSAFTFGGGYVIISLMKKKIVDELGWLEEEEMLNLAAIAQSSPGPIAANAAVLLGYQVAGKLGALVCIFGTVLPPFIIITIIAQFYDSFKENQYVSVVLDNVQAGVAAIIADVVLTMGGAIVRDKKIVSIITMVLAFVANYFLNINIVLIILACGIIGAVQAVLILKTDSER